MEQSRAQFYQAGEHDTGKKWAGDGISPIYRKTVSFGALPSTATKTVAHGLTAGAVAGNMDLSKFGKVVEVNAQDPDATPALSISENSIGITDASIIGDNISITTGANLTAYTQCYVTIEYCKVPA